MRSKRSRPNLTLLTLGKQIKSERERLKESLAEVSGAVEIDIDDMQRIENGEAAPSEETLLLLISHFDLNDDTATRLWEMAGYGDETGENEFYKSNDVMTPDDLKIAYTDMVHVAANEYGVTMNFMQSTGAGSQPMLISRLGMSREHAQYIIDSLSESIKQNQKSIQPPKALPSPKLHKKTDSH